MKRIAAWRILRDMDPTVPPFRRAVLALLGVSTVLYWLAYADHQRVIAERQDTVAATTMPIALNGFKPDLGRLLSTAGASVRIDEVRRRGPLLIFAVSDTCAGCDITVPQWLEWIRDRQSLDYGALVVSVNGAAYLMQITEAVKATGRVATGVEVAGESRQYEFVRLSAMSVTPMLLAVDDNGYVRVIVKTFTVRAQKILEEFLNQQSRR